MKKVLIGIIVAMLVITSIAVAETQISAPDEDNNRATVAQVEELNSREMAAVDRYPPGTIALAYIMGPPTSFDITVNVKNLVPNSQIRFVEVNPLLAKTSDGSRLIFDGIGVISSVPPSGGTLDGLYPNGTALPGAMVECTGFDYNEVASFKLDPDTFDDPAYGATVSEMEGCIIKIWFEDGTTAGIGTLSDYMGHQVCVVREM